MKVIFRHSKSVKGKHNFSFIEPIITTFDKLLFDLYDKIFVLIADEKAIKKGFFKQEETKIFGAPSKLISRKKAATSSSNFPPLGCIKIHLDLFDTFQDWKQKLEIKHECCHLLHSRSIFSKTLNELINEYSFDLLREIIWCRREYVVHLCILKRYLKDWLREPKGITKMTISPHNYYQEEKRKIGTGNMIMFTISKCIAILSFIYLYEFIASKDKLSSELKKDLKRFYQYLKSFSEQISRDTKNKIRIEPDIITKEDFEDEELFFNKIKIILEMLDKLFNRKSIR